MAKNKSAKKLKSARLKIRVRVLPHCEGLPLPEMQSDGAAGLDLVAAVDAKKPIRIPSGKFARIPTGLALEIPAGAEAQVRPRSGLAADFGVTVLNSPGTIDSDYRGEVQVILINHGDKPFVVNRGDRIAQMIVSTYARVKLKPVTELSPTGRGAGGFGSTGKATKSAPKSATKAAKKSAPAKPKSSRRRSAKKQS